VTLIHTDHEHPGDGEHPSAQRTGDQATSELAEVARKREGHVHPYASGEEFKLVECCPFVMPSGGEGLREEVWIQALKMLQQANDRATPGVPAKVLSLVDSRQEARSRKDWSEADRIRGEIASLGWQIKDTPEGPQVEPLEM
jgi:cysteinyl-tRNA synthetase